MVVGVGARYGREGGGERDAATVLGVLRFAGVSSRTALAVVDMTRSPGGAVAHVYRKR
jgi:hypothetical protein